MKGKLAFAITALLLLAFAGGPLFAILKTAFADGGAPLWHELRDESAHSAWLHSVLMALCVTLLASALGGFFAFVLERSDAFDSGWIRAALAVPLAVPPYLLAMSWAILGSGRSGLLNQPFASPWLDVYGLDGVILVLTTSSYPFVMLAVQASLRSSDPSLEEAARVSGARPFDVIKTVTLPLAAPSLLAAAGLVFVFATAAFGVPYLLGSVAEPPVFFLTTRIFQYTTLGGEEMLARAAALAVVLLLTSVIAQGAASWWGSRRSAIQVSGKASRRARFALGAARPWVRAAVVVFIAVFVVMPLVTIAALSFSKSLADPTSLTTTHWQSVLLRQETLRAFAHSFGLALGAGALVALLGFVIARMAKTQGRRGRWLAVAASSPYAVPGTVLAIGFVLAFSAEVRVVMLDWLTLALYLPGTLALLLVAYAVKYLAFGVRGSKAALEQVHPSLEEAARTSGASPLKAVRDIAFPLVRPAVLASFVVVALPCLSELTMSVLLFGAGTETTGTLLFELQSYADPPAASVVATLVVIVALLGDAVVRRVQKESP